MRHRRLKGFKKTLNQKEDTRRHQTTRRVGSRRCDVNSPTNTILSKYIE